MEVKNSSSYDKKSHELSNEELKQVTGGAKKALALNTRFAKDEAAAKCMAIAGVLLKCEAIPGVNVKIAGGMTDVDVTNTEFDLSGGAVAGGSGDNAGYNTAR